MKVWITKYALTVGVYVVDGEQSTRSSMIEVRDDKGLYQFFHSPDFHTTRSAAITRANEMLEAKKLSLRKNLTFLETIDFNLSPE